jgi:AraC family transcriptional regulator
MCRARRLLQPGSVDFCAAAKRITPCGCDQPWSHTYKLDFPASVRPNHFMESRLTLQHVSEKYGTSGLLASSADRGWSGFAAELRSHSGGVISWESPQRHTEICVDVCGGGAVVTRRIDGIADRTASERGMIWLSPAGSQEGFLDISDAVPGVLHIFMPPDRFSPAALGVDLDRSAIESLRCHGGFHDPLLAEIAYAISSELRWPTSAGRVLADTLAASLAARLVQAHLGRSAPRLPAASGRKALDPRRLTRVLDYIEAHLESDLTIDCLASVACLSQFHFARAFKAAIGQSPHRYISGKRLERAKALLRGDRSLVDIALALNFSCQANFTRAFRQMMGQTPGQYRRGFSA